ncbi:unnamed protein product [Meganyctiphanes norvegica]|uniref:D-beta-hydroxybutyrate dehydrogenase, mitochondrial n=1 Tax=Meganyctiphanes norvegica TaxID=48144 RepID=A0AAV2QNP5_MEGNR
MITQYNSSKHIFILQTPFIVGRELGFKMLWTGDKVFRVLFLGGLSLVLASLACLLQLASVTIVFPVLWAISAGIYLYTAQLQVPVSGKAVVVTGCDTGFGLQLAQQLDKMGFRVFAGCLQAEDGEGAKTLREVGSDRLHVLQMDITKTDQLDKATKEVLAKLAPGEVLWGIVNNAGWATYGEMEWVGLDTYRKILEINLIGIIAVTQAFLPMIRDAKGRVVTISSGLGRFAVPMRSPYVASKYAVEGLMDCLRYEMKPWGVNVSLIEPGNFIAGTNIFNQKTIADQAEAMWAGMTERVRADYGKDHFDSRVNLMTKYSTGGCTDLSPVLNAYIEGLTQAYPQERYNPMDFYFRARLFIATHLPEIFYDNIYIDYLKK